MLEHIGKRWRTCHMGLSMAGYGGVEGARLREGSQVCPKKDQNGPIGDSPQRAVLIRTGTVPNRAILAQTNQSPIDRFVGNIDSEPFSGVDSQILA
jgi:hypothetical protein